MKRYLLIVAASLLVATGVMGVASATPNEHANEHAFGNGNVHAQGHGADKVSLCKVAGNSGKTKEHSVSVHAAANERSGWSSCGGGGGRSFTAATFAGGLAETR